MPDQDMSISVNGQSQVPPGFRFHPTEEELLHYYLKKKVCCEKIDLDVIRDVDLNKLEPWDIQERCKIGSTPQNDWYFFSHKDKKYPTGTRTNRATAAGFWKATGRDKIIYSSSKRIGMRKTLVFYKGRAPHGQKSDWIMHEYRLDDNNNNNDSNGSNSIGGESTQEDGWVVCRVFKKKNLHKSLDNSNGSSSLANSKIQMLNTSSDGSLDQILHYMGRNTTTACKQENEMNNNNTININTSCNNNNSSNMRILRQFEGAMGSERFVQLPGLESPTSLLPSLSNNNCNTRLLHHDQSSSTTSNQGCYQPNHEVNLIDTSDEAYVTNNHGGGNGHLESIYETGLNDWAALDRLVASHLHGQADTSNFASAFCNTTHDNHDLQLPTVRSSSTTRLYHSSQDFNSEIDLWNFTARSSSSSSDPLCHVSGSPM